MHHLQHISELGSLVEKLGARHVIIAPGSRNAPLIQLFTSHKSFICHSIVDERSAGYVALGMGDPFLDVSIGCGGNNGTRQLAVADRVDRVLSGEQPTAMEQQAAGAAFLPPAV